MIEILIGGDVCTMGSMEPLFVAGDAPAIFHDLLGEISAAHLAIVNLECPLVSKKTPINKAGGAVLGAATECIRGFTASKWHLLNMANNHSFDQGTEGLAETIETIGRAGLSVVGAGLDLAQAKVPYVTQIAGRRIVVYSMAEREYSVADESGGGSNPLDLIGFVEAVREHKQGGLFVVLLHTGTDSPYPPPEVVRRCRFMVDMGADAVICSHPHRPLPWEIYREKPIVYGTGNLVFEELHQPLQNPPTGWHEGYMVKLSIDGERVGMTPIPYFQCRPVLGAIKMDERAHREFLADMQQRGDRLKDPEFLQLEWTKYCAEHKESYLTYLYGHNRWARKLSRLLNYPLHSSDDVLRSLLLCQCETHVELLSRIFREERKVKR